MIRKAGRRAAVRAALGAVAAMSITLAGTQAGLAGTHTAGSGWVLQTVPAPAGRFGGGLSGVSCTSADACMAIGDFSTKKGDVPFAEAWNGTSWTLGVLAAPAPDVNMFGLSCPSPSSCIAVGRTFSPPSSTMPLAEIWNGTSWSFQSPPMPPGAIAATLAADSCTSPVRCVAVGYDTGGSFSESWNGTTWTPSSAPGGSSSEFLGVSCRSYRSCTAVGEVGSARDPLAESWDGSHWTEQPVPAPSAQHTLAPLEGVSCHSATDCMAVGIAGGPRSFQTLAEQWNGTAWTILSMPRVGGPNAANNLLGVSCPRAAKCTAVGDARIRGDNKLLVERWNGTRWTVGDPVEPPRHNIDAFSGVSCLAKQGCIAVGDYAGLKPKSFPLAEQHS